MYSDNQSAIHLAKNSAFHSKTKHIQLKYHFIRSILDEELLKLVNHVIYVSLYNVFNVFFILFNDLTVYVLLCCSHVF